ncbi:MAG: phosphocholine cytidylyltransferase family protein [Alphaproteobacteria bacterium]|nr:phosphocholine cytidylyltransferase family protein [Alphaproteobacteria bacterium]
MKAVILAAGRGRRMNAMTEDKPKCLVELKGMALVERMISSLASAGISDVALITGYQRQALDYLGLPSFHNPDWASTNMVKSLMHASYWLEKEPVIVCYGDVFTASDILMKLKDSEACLSVAYDLSWHDLWSRRFNDVLSDAETFRIDGDRIIEIGRKPVNLEEIQGQYMGLFKTTPSSWGHLTGCFSRLSESRQNDISVTELFQLLINEECTITGIPARGQWGEVDSPDDLSLYEDLIDHQFFGNWLKVASRKKQSS